MRSEDGAPCSLFTSHESQPPLLRSGRRLGGPTDGIIHYAVHFTEPPEGLLAATLVRADRLLAAGARFGDKGQFNLTDGRLFKLHTPSV